MTNWDRFIDAINRNIQTPPDWDQFYDLPPSAPDEGDLFPWESPSAETPVTVYAEDPYGPGWIEHTQPLETWYSDIIEKDKFDMIEEYGIDNIDVIDRLIRLGYWDDSEDSDDWEWFRENYGAIHG